MRTRKVYKLVFEDPSGKLLSAIVRGPIQIEYGLGVWTIGRYGPILAFTDLKSAASFWRSCIRTQRWKVYAAEARGVRPVKVLMGFGLLPQPGCGPASGALVRTFWSNRRAFRGDRIWAPFGTVACRAVKLLHEVPRHELE